MNDQKPILELEVAADGRTLGVCVWGDPAGAPVFWLHGTPGSRMLRHDVDGYRAHRLHVCTYDRPGYGLSTRLMSSPPPVAVATVRHGQAETRTCIRRSQRSRSRSPRPRFSSRSAHR